MKDELMTSTISKLIDQAIKYQPDRKTSSIYDNMQAVKKELMPVDVPDLVRLIN